MSQLFVVVPVADSVQSASSFIWDQIRITRDFDSAKADVISHALNYVQSCLRHGLTLQQMQDSDVAKFRIKEFTYLLAQNRFTHVCDYKIQGLITSLQQWNATHAASLTPSQFIAQMIQQPQLAIGCIKPQ